MNGIDSLALQLQKTINEKDKNKKTGYDTQATVVKVEDDTIWVKIPGGVDETPVAKTTSAKPGDTVQVRVSGGRAWVVGNYTSPPTDDTRADTAYILAEGADEKAKQAIDSAAIAKIAADQATEDAERAHEAADVATAAATEAQEAVETLTDRVDGLDTRVDTAEEKLETIEGDIDTLETDVNTAKTNITTIQGDISTLQTDVSTAQGNITSIQGDISDLQTDVDDAKDDISTLQADVSTAQGNISTIQGNITTLQSDVSTAKTNISTLQSDVSTAQGNITAIQGDISDLESDVDDAKSDISSLKTDVSTAKTNISTIQGNITTLQSDVSSAQTSITNIQGDISDLETDVSAAQGDIVTLQQNVSDAQDDIDDALEGLALAENVIGTLNWLTAHSKATTDTTPVSGKSYYIRNQDGTFVLVTDTTGKNPASEGWYEMDEAISNYVAAHLSLTDYGLNLTLDNTSYRIHIGTYTATGDDGVYIIDGNGNIVSYFGENIRFSDNKAQYIGNENAYIVFNPANGGSITIGGSQVNIGNNKTLSELIAEVSNTFIFDVTYTVTGTDPNRIAHFEAHLYKGGVDVKEHVDGNNEPLYPAEMFTWYLKHEDSQTQEGDYIGSGYRINVNLSTCNYGAEVIAHFTTTEDSPLLNGDDDNLTDVNNNNLTGRTESGESVRVRDLTVVTTLAGTDKLMIVGSEDEHLVSVSSLQAYLNANLDKQVKFNTTAGWDAQTSLVSQANTLYVYTDHQRDSQGNNVAGIKVGDGNAYVVDLPFTDAIATEHIADTTRHITASERNFWNNKVRCYYASGDELIFTTA